MVPYHQPVAPVTPFVQVNAPEMIMEGGRQGLQAFLQASQMRQRYQLESQQLIQQAALSEQKNQLEREKMGLDFVMGTQQLEMQKEWHKDATNAAMTNANANYIRAQSGLGAKTEMAKLKAETVADFNKQMQKYGLLDPNPNPVDFYSKYQALNDEFQFTNLPEIKQTLSALKAQANQHTVEVEDGNSKRQIPVGQIVERLRNPDTAEATKKFLQKNKLLTPKSKGWFGLGASDEKLDPSIQPYVKMGEGVEFKRAKARPPIVNPALSDANNEAAPLEGEPLFPPTDTEKQHEVYIQSYLRHRGDPNFDDAAARQFLQDNGVDLSKIP